MAIYELNFMPTGEIQAVSADKQIAAASARRKRHHIPAPPTVPHPTLVEVTRLSQGKLPIEIHSYTAIRADTILEQTEIFGPDGKGHLSSKIVFERTIFRHRINDIKPRIGDRGFRYIRGGRKGKAEAR
jgi:hypothetical protein